MTHSVEVSCLVNPKLGKCFIVYNNSKPIACGKQYYQKIQGWINPECKYECLCKKEQN